MDKKGDQGTNRWAWLREFMPGVAAQMAEKRREMGEAHVALCWRRGVVELQPGWFFACEGPIAVGVPLADDPVMAAFLSAKLTRTQAVLMLRNPEVADGTH